jgi:hypothetical protein
MALSLSRCYELLGLKQGASQEAVKEAYRDMVKVWHPDRFQQDAALKLKAEEMLKQVNLAYKILTGAEPAAPEKEPVKPVPPYRPVHPPSFQNLPEPKTSSPFPWQKIGTTLLIVGFLAFLFTPSGKDPRNPGKPGPSPAVHLLYQIKGEMHRFWRGLTGGPRRPPPHKRPLRQPARFK